MIIFCIRHAVAAERGDWAQFSESDERRPLTPRGAQDFSYVARAIRASFESVDLKLIVHSGYTRGLQTAQLLRQHFPNADIQTCNRLQHGVGFKQLRKAIVGHASDYSKKSDGIAFIGHNPEMQEFIFKQSNVEWTMKKASVCVYEFDIEHGKEQIQIHSLWNAKQLIELGRFIERLEKAADSKDVRSAL